ncbi:hypothetical protein HGRIS_004686 [Hohenbuehelia grisea]|uniref:Peptidase M43 pregnancy-associated plasma-A domain-containing protein n=1 Tax=Hohenbuehelia grisea TaxID=104357 RepID=A0ABR3JDH7_9AGAR
MFSHRILAALASATFVFGTPLNTANNSSTICGSNPSPEWLAEAEKHFLANRVDLPSKADYRNVVIPVYFHVISRDRTLAGGNIADYQIYQQIEALNGGYQGTGLSWRLMDITRTVKPAWFEAVIDSVYTREEYEMKSQLRQGGPETLNIYTVGFSRSPTLLGFATYPYNYQFDRIRDGAVLRFTALPGGLYPYDRGVTGIHEAGHWVGLAHPFDGGCDGGDGVADTPAEAQPAFFCTPRDSCPGPRYPGTDPIYNFMDYTDDACREEFTPGQIARLRSQIATYRGYPQ